MIPLGKRFNNKGESYIEAAVLVLAGTFFLVFCLSVFEFLIQKQKLDFFAKELVETAAAYGTTAGPAEERYVNLCNRLGIAPVCDYSGTDYYDQSREAVQLGEEISLELTLSNSMGIAGLFNFPVTITARSSGLSQQYWKQ